MMTMLFPGGTLYFSESIPTNITTHRPMKKLNTGTEDTSLANVSYFV
jgi:hypothetical protein